MTSPRLPAHQMLALVLDALPVSLFWKDLDSRILGCNQKFAHDSGVAHPSDLIGKTNFDFYPKEQAEAFRADDLEVMSTGVAKLCIEESLLLATGETAWVETNKVPMRTKAGVVIGVLGTYRDVTERHRADKERTRLAFELAEAKQAAALAQVEYLAYYDPLTGLANRTLFLERVEHKLSKIRPDHAKCAVFVPEPRALQVDQRCAWSKSWR
jgi:PAS domain S-box-containing protein